MKEVFTKSFWRGVRKTFDQALEDPPPPADLASAVSVVAVPVSRGIQQVAGLAVHQNARFARHPGDVPLDLTILEQPLAVIFDHFVRVSAARSA